MFNKIHHVAIICSDYARSKDFYVNVLGLKIVQEVYREARQSYKLDLAINDHYQIELFSFKQVPARASRPEAAGLRHLAFEVNDLDVVIAELIFKGVMMEPVRVDEYTGKRFTFFADPDGLPLELYEAQGMGGLFRFKKFEVEQSDCAMRINTDGVLLGAIVTHPQPYYILDIGTGTGVIGMMLAQRFPQAEVMAVEIDGPAALRAASNFEGSPFASRLQVQHSDIALYQSEDRYELIVSNPPYFVNDLKNPEHRKGIARHAGDDFFEGLLRKVANILAENGNFWVILPAKQAQVLVTNAVLYKLFPERIIHVHSDASKPEFRQIVCFGFANIAVRHENIYIYAAEGVYTDAYKFLLKDFFLAF